MHCGVKDYNSMSEDNAGESKTESFEKKDEEDSTLVRLLSEYSKKLESRVKLRYIEKISVILTRLRCGTRSSNQTAYHPWKPQIYCRIWF